MKTPKGFGKKYFTFASILAHCVNSKLQSQVSSLYSFLNEKKDKDQSSQLDENDPPADIFETLLLLNTKPCHCNCFYKLKTKLTILHNSYIPRCVYYTTYFAFRRSGIHPPL
ncbi:MAG: hypothetical protein U9O56_10710 [Campylobacterota bacterium]|nr:hypothetical protein [Campylobacterota bacterium]